MERRKLALKNLRKAWAARRKKSLKISKPVRSRRGQTSIGIYCERYGAARVILSIARWASRNSHALLRAGHLTEARAYDAMAKQLLIYSAKKKGM